MASTTKTKPRTFRTGIGLPDGVRGEMIDLLNARLADTLDLYSQTKQAHWNVKGPEFIALRKLSNEVSDEVKEYIDTIAARAVPHRHRGVYALTVPHRGTIDQRFTFGDRPWAVTTSPASSLFLRTLSGVKSV